jgi:hypothetical protein
LPTARRALTPTAERATWLRLTEPTTSAAAAVWLSRLRPEMKRGEGWWTLAPCHPGLTPADREPRRRRHSLSITGGPINERTQSGPSRGTTLARSSSRGCGSEASTFHPSLPMTLSRRPMRTSLRIPNCSKRPPRLFALLHISEHSVSAMHANTRETKHD